MNKNEFILSMFWKLVSLLIQKIKGQQGSKEQNWAQIGGIYIKMINQKQSFEMKQRVY